MSRRAWLTTDTDTAAEFLCRRVLIPNDVQLVAAVNGALLELTKADNWEQFGAASPEATAALFQAMFYDYLDSECEMAVNRIGEVIMAMTDDTPAGCLPCDGSTYTEAQYPDLYAVIHTSLKNTVAHTFTTPDMRGRAPVGRDGNAAGFPNHPTNDKWGAATHTLSITEIPAHTHTYVQGSNGTAGGGTVAQIYNRAGAGNVNTGSAGNGGAHNNYQPSIAVQFYIVAE